MCGFSAVLYTSGSAPPEVIEADLQKSLGYLTHRCVPVCTAAHRINAESEQACNNRLLGDRTRLESTSTPPVPSVRGNHPSERRNSY